MTQTITIAGRSFTVEPKYSEGHTLTANEASALNQLRSENLRNNFAQKAKDGASQEDFDKYASSYEFGVRTGGGRTSDPVEAAAMEIARETIRDALRKAGKKLTDYKAAQISAAAAKLLEGDRGPSIREAAKRRVEEMQSAAAGDLSDDLMEVLNTPVESASTEGEAEASTVEAPASNRRRAAAAE